MPNDNPKTLVNKRIVRLWPIFSVHFFDVYFILTSFVSLHSATRITNRSKRRMRRNNDDRPRPSKAKRKSCLYKSYARCSNSFSRIKKVLISTLIDLWTNNNVWSVLMVWIVLYIRQWFVSDCVCVCVCVSLCACVPGQICW